MLANDYRYSVVGDPKRKYLLILSRNKKLSNGDKKTILAGLPSLGYDPALLFWNSVHLSEAGSK